MNFWEVIFLFFAFQAFLFAWFFFLKEKGDRVANVILGTYLVLFALNLSYNVLYWSKLLFRLENIHFFGILAVIWTCYPPLIYLYTKRVIGKKRIGVKDSIHALPFLICLWCYGPFFILTAENKLKVFSEGSLGQYVHFLPYLVWGIASIMLFYTILTYFSFKNYSISRNKRRWFHWVLGSFSSYVLAMLIYFVLSRMKIITTGHDYFIMYTIVFFIGAMAYFGFKQPEIFDGLSMDQILPFKKYQKTGLTSAHSKELKKLLKTYFEKNQPHLNSELRLDDLATQLNLSRHHTSQIINEHFDSNFYDFVNRYRIEEAKKLLRNKNELTITDVIFSSGFNNRDSFYKAFKKHTKTTPTAYKKNLAQTQQ